jgi:predicted esterase
MYHRARVLIAGALLCASARPAAAVSALRDTLRPGVVIDTVHSLSDTSQTYALYLPSTYDKSRHWPLLLLMDPRGRALVPMRLFRAAAERYGYIVMSSYQTQSDGPVEPNDKAVDAMLDDAQSRFSVDIHRFYFAGFSGTGRLAWYYAYSIPDNVAGLIETGAGLPNPDLLLQKNVAKAPTPFAVFLSVGTSDFNYQEVRGLDNRLGVFGVRHHLEQFDGPHSWPPESVCTDALVWMQLQAMRDGRVATNHPWIDSLFNTSVTTIDSLARNDAYAASVLFSQAASDFAGLHDTNAIAASANRLAQSEAAKRAAKRISSLATDEEAFHEREESFYAEFARDNSPPSVEKIRSTLRLSELRNRARQTSDTLDALSAKRMLASVSVRTSFYEPRRYLAQGDTLKALTMYAVAQSIQSENSQLCAERDRVYRSYAIRRSVAPELGCEHSP